MGNICSSSKNEAEPFSRPGRVLGSAPPSDPAPRAPLPTKPKANWGTPGRTVGDTRGSDVADARANAAIAAQKRAESATAPKGKLGTKLAAQKAQTSNQVLSEASRDTTAARNIDQSAEAMRWN